MIANISGKTAVVGIGATEFSKNSGRSEMRLAVECVLAALDDAGISPKEVDGISAFVSDTNTELDVFNNIGGKELKFFSRIQYGGGATYGTIQQAAMAITTGLCNVVVCYRAMNERSMYRYGTSMFDKSPDATAVRQYTWYSPYGMVTPANWVAMSARRYMHDYSVTSEDFGRVSVAARDFASTNPNAWFYGKPITLEDHQKSRWIAEPLRLLDCCQESDGGVALVVTSIERARDLKQKPAVIYAAAQGACQNTSMLTNYYHPNMTDLPETSLIAEQMYRQAKLSPNDIDAAMIYDNFSPCVLMQLEALGFCKKGEAKDFIKDGHIGRGGSLPVNTHGGQIGEAYIQAMNSAAEAVRQIRGTAANQLKDVDYILGTAGPGLPSSGAIFGRLFK